MTLSLPISLYKCKHPYSEQSPTELRTRSSRLLSACCRGCWWSDIVLQLHGDSYSRDGVTVSASYRRGPVAVTPRGAHTNRRRRRLLPWNPDTWAEKFNSFERINSLRETNENFNWRNTCKRLGTSRLHELRQSKFSFVHVPNLSVLTFEFFCWCIRGHVVTPDGHRAVAKWDGLTAANNSGRVHCALCTVQHALYYNYRQTSNHRLKVETNSEAQVQ